MTLLQRELVVEDERTLAERACADAARRRTPVLLAITRDVTPLDALALYGRAVSSGYDATYWEQPSNASVTVAAGVTAGIEARGERRFADTAAAWRRFAEAAVTNRRRALTAFAGFAFAVGRRATHWRGFGDGAFVVPALTYRASGAGSEATLPTMVHPGQTAAEVAFELAPLLAAGPPRTAERPEAGRLTFASCDNGRWADAVGTVTTAVDAGIVDKAVIAREVLLRAEGAFDSELAIARLSAGFPACTVFAFHRDGTCFLGATPERLVRVQGPSVYATCLAGTAPRGNDGAADAAAAAGLLRDPKERREHEFVVRMIADALAPVCREIAMPSEPSIMRMPNLLHLHTPISGTLTGRASVLELVARMHPTPAVGGTPPGAALALIARAETFDRGWYAGPVGWIDADGDGEFAVALRSALVRGAEARLFAGCGIVAGSDTQREYKESALKLRPMLWALGGRDTPGSNRPSGGQQRRKTS